MNDQDINLKLPEVMNIRVVDIDYRNGADVCRAALKTNQRDVWYFDYRDPAIFAENVKWLLDNDYILRSSKEPSLYCVIKRNDPTRSPCDEDLFKCVALARIAAKE